MDRHELEHSINCSVRIERMTSTFNRRLDQGTTFIQIALSLAVFADVAAIKAVGATLSLITVWAFVYRPSSKALLASQQQRRYENLCTRMRSLSDEELSKKFASIGKRDSEPADFICKAAENALHVNAESNPPHTLGAIQRILLLIAGS